ncbi:MAG: TonB-dependent receptor [Pseudomonadota bacterium]
MRRSHTCLKNLKLALLCGTACLFQTDATAGQDLSEQAYLQDLPVVLSASRLLQPLSEAPNAMTVIDRRMIRDSGFRNIADLFRLVPGMYVGNAGANTPIVSLNGVSDQYSRRMQVLIDGRSIYLPPFGGVAWQELPLLIEDIERIEVVRGPAAASHGSNSFYGVINIITQDASGGSGAAVSASRGEMGIADAAARFGGSVADFDYRLSFGYRADDGDNPQVVNDGSVNRLMNLRSHYRVDGDNTLEFMFGLGDGTSGQGTAGRFQEPFREASTRNDFQQLIWLHTWPGRDESRLTLSRTAREYTDPYKCIDNQACISGAPQAFAPDVARSRRQELEFQNTTQLGDNNRAVWGGGIRADHVNQPLLFPGQITLHQSRIFAHDEWRASESVLLNIGAMYEDDGAGHKSTSPRAALNYHLYPQHTLRASISSATRNPMMVEMYMSTAPQTYWSNGYIPPAENLRPERILSKEIGYVGQFGALSLDGRAYYDKVRDIIMIDGFVNYVDGSFTLDNRSDSFKNLFDATYKGVDLSAKYRWTDGSVTASYSHQQGSCAFSSYPTQYFNPDIGQPVVQPAYQSEYLDLCSQSVPADSGSLLFEQQVDETFRLSLGYYARSKIRVTDVSSGFPAESPMRRVDLRMAWQLGKAERTGGGEIAVVLQNAFQDNYTGYGNVSQRVGLNFKRRAYITATFNI